jgi:hypothetical protein
MLWIHTLRLPGGSCTQRRDMTYADRC